MVDYLTDKSEENNEFLAKHCPRLLGLYAELLAQCPELRILALEEKEMRGPVFQPRLQADSEERLTPAIVMPFSRMDGFWDFYDEKDLANKCSVARMLGCELEDLQGRQDLYVDFIFLHECGHAVDFVRHELKPKLVVHGVAMDDNGVVCGEMSDAQLAQALDELSDLRGPQLRRERAMQMHPRTAMRVGVDRLRLFASRLNTMDLRSDKERELVANSLHKEVPSERYADNFALRFIVGRAEAYGELATKVGVLVKEHVLRADEEPSYGLYAGQRFETEVGEQIVLTRSLRVGEVFACEVYERGRVSERRQTEAKLSDIVFETDLSGAETVDYVRLGFADGHEQKLKLLHVAEPFMRSSFEEMYKELQLDDGMELYLHAVEDEGGVAGERLTYDDIFGGKLKALRDDSGEVAGLELIGEYGTRLEDIESVWRRRGEYRVANLQKGRRICWEVLKLAD